MLRAVAVPCLMSMLLPAAAMATDYSKVRCENPRFIGYMASRLPMLKAASTGRAFSASFSDQNITRSTTLSSAPDKITCELTLNLSARGVARPINGRFTTQQTANGKTTWHWQPGY